MDLYSLITNLSTAEFIINLSIQIIAVSLIGWIVMKLWRPRSAPARSAGYLAVLISIAILPFFSGIFNFNQVTWFESTIELPQQNKHQSREPLYNDIQNFESMSTGVKAQSDTFEENQTSFFTRDRILLAANIFGGIWIAGFIVFILRLGFKLSFLKGYMHNLSTDDSERLKNVYNSIKHVFNDRPMPEIFFSSSLSSPVTVGIIKPVMILPVEVRDITDDELKSILLHELAHIFHSDNFIGFFQHVISSLFWWNPIIYSLNTAYSDSREDICDNYAINVLKSPKKYATTLLNLAEKTCLFSNMPAAAGMSLSKKSLEHRVMELLKTDRDLSTLIKPSLIILSLIVAVAICYFGLGMRICFKDEAAPERTESSKERQKKDANYSINPSPGVGWKKRPGGSFNDMIFILPGKMSFIYVAGIHVPEGYSWMGAEDLFMSWNNGMKDKYQYEDFKIVSSGETNIDGRETYYAVYEYIFNNVMKKEKVYYIRGDSSVYRIRYNSSINTYNETLHTFEEYFKSFKIAP